jgi:hypothetical protein
MKITLDKEEIKEAVSQYLVRKFNKEYQNITQITLHRKASQSEDVGSITIELSK